MPDVYWWPLIGLLLLLSYEIFAATTNRVPTLSEIIWRASGVRVRCPHCGTWFRQRIVWGIALAFGFGVMCGHFFA